MHFEQSQSNLPKATKNDEVTQTYSNHHSITLLVSLTTSCGIDEKKPVSSEEQDRHNEQNEKGKSKEELEDLGRIRPIAR